MSVLKKSVRTQKTLSAHDASQTAIGKACTHFIEKSRSTRLQFCLLLRHNAILRRKKKHSQELRKYKPSKMKVNIHVSNSETKQKA